MSKHLTTQMEHLNTLFLALSKTVEDNFDKCIYALEKDDVEISRQLIDGDDEIDKREIEIEEECLKILALYQPVAIDLRVIVSILKVNSDLERIGDLTGNICSRIIRMSDFEIFTFKDFLVEMAQKVRTILQDSIRAFMEKDGVLALDVLKQDSEIDELHASMYKMSQAKMSEEVENIPYYVNCITVTRFLERIADHAKNIAEDLYYMIHGEIIRHEDIAKF